MDIESAGINRLGVESANGEAARQGQVLCSVFRVGGMSIIPWLLWRAIKRLVAGEFGNDG